ncbi:MAG: DJ-1/PfpI family protein [Peptoniphilaceae bacterium]|nr:DJ-1/PfpI family protein [Peptoniphilaceae bacterium]MDY6019709.1 DJ-1 family glyoxalase III [Anaerococcus sp.]
MEKVLVFLADGFEEVEALTPVDFLRRAGIVVDTVSTKEDKKVVGSHKIPVLADKLIAEIDPKDYSLAYIPGGIPGATNLRDDQKVIDLIKAIDQNKGRVAAICAGPIVLERAGLLAGKEATSFPGFDKDLESVKTYVDDQLVVVDGNIITGRGPAIALYEALKLVEILKGKEAKEELKNQLQQDKVEKYFGF